MPDTAKGGRLSQCSAAHYYTPPTTTTVITAPLARRPPFSFGFMPPCAFGGGRLGLNTAAQPVASGPPHLLARSGRWTRLLLLLLHPTQTTRGQTLSLPRFPFFPCTIPIATRRQPSIDFLVFLTSPRFWPGFYFPHFFTINFHFLFTVFVTRFAASNFESSQVTPLQSPATQLPSLDCQKAPLPVGHSLAFRPLRLPFILSAWIYFSAVFAHPGCW